MINVLRSALEHSGRSYPIYHCLLNRAGLVVVWNYLLSNTSVFVIEPQHPDVANGGGVK